MYRDFRIVEYVQPYIAGFLAFREVDHFLPIFDTLKREAPQFIPDVILVDGNGVLHHRGFGLASHLGVLIDLPTIGIGKNLLCVDGLSRDGVRDECRRTLQERGDKLDLVGDSGRLWGVVSLYAASKFCVMIFVSGIEVRSEREEPCVCLNRPSSIIEVSDRNHACSFRTQDS